MGEAKEDRSGKLAIPHYRFLLSSGKSVLIDAFFISSVRVPARRALLVFPMREGSKASNDAVIVEPLYKPEEALRLLVDALDWSINARYEFSLTRFKKFRLSLIFPVAWFRRGEHLINEGRGNILIDDAELNAAISLLKGILGGTSSTDRIKYEGISYVPLIVRGDCAGLGELVSPSPTVMRNYSWLLKVDTGFRNRMNNLVRDLFGCMNK